MYKWERVGGFCMIATVQLRDMCQHHECVPNSFWTRLKWACIEVPTRSLTWSLMWSPWCVSWMYLLLSWFALFCCFLFFTKQELHSTLWGSWCWTGKNVSWMSLERVFMFAYVSELHCACIVLYMAKCWEAVPLYGQRYSTVPSSATTASKSWFYNVKCKRGHRGNHWLKTLNMWQKRATHLVWSSGFCSGSRLVSSDSSSPESNTTKQEDN